MNKDFSKMDVGLSAPWYTFANQIKYTYGLSPFITVNNLAPVGDNYDLIINVCYDDVALALRQILPSFVSFGGVIVYINIFNSENQIVPIENAVYTPETLAKLLCTALIGNPLFEGTILTNGILPPIVSGTVGDVVVVIAKDIVQFYNDDISDLCSNYNAVAADVFEQITTLSYLENLKISFSTCDPNCEMQKNIYCC